LSTIIIVDIRKEQLNNNESTISNEYCITKHILNLLVSSCWMLNLQHNIGRLDLSAKVKVVLASYDIIWCQKSSGFWSTSWLLDMTSILHLSWFCPLQPTQNNQSRTTRNQSILMMISDTIMSIQLRFLSYWIFTRNENPFPF
jgi:hypothetical protein